MIEKINKWLPILTFVLVLVALALVGGNQSGNANNVGASGSRFPNGISSDTTSPIEGQVRGTYLAITGLFTADGGTLKSYPNASSSVTTATLKQSDLLSYDTVLLTPTGAAATKTLTFPASSTLTTFIPTAGDRQETCFFNATTTAATTITFAAGTGIDLEVATSTGSTGGAMDLVLGADNMGCFTFLRKTDTDIVAGFLEYSNAD